VKRTHKRRALVDVAGIVASSDSVASAALRLGVHRSTIFRWIEAGHVPAPGHATPAAVPMPTCPRVRPLAARAEPGGPLDPRPSLRLEGHALAAWQTRRAALL
jgi:hypothetical protein